MITEMIATASRRPIECCSASRASPSMTLTGTARMPYVAAVGSDRRLAATGHDHEVIEPIRCRTEVRPRQIVSHDQALTAVTGRERMADHAPRIREVHRRPF